MPDPFRALRGRASSPARPRATAYSRPHRTAPHGTDMLISDSPSDPASGPVREPGC
ncbi:hypothetical protein [Streptomyces sp. NPDC059409]|uniref:hypothetical protein n=1 Tax=Streptomyces sp. NPDC059409 TaxID=3346824 RepID=UPI00367A80B9